MIAEGEFSEDETIRFRGKRIFKEFAIYNYIEKLTAISSSNRIYDNLSYHYR